MNKTVSVTNMQVTAHAEEGLLINEVASATSTTWDELATTSQDSDSAIALRPASTKNLSTWWHANSLKTNTEAGQGDDGVDTTNTQEIGNSNYYKDISSLSDSDVIEASDGQSALTEVFWDDATFGGSEGTYDPGEGYYVRYTYYLKSSGSVDLKVAPSAFKVKVKVTNNDEDSDEKSDKLDAALRVGVIMSSDLDTSFASDFIIFAPVTGATTNYKVTGGTDGSDGATPTVITASTGSESELTAIGTGEDKTITIPKVSDNGKAIYVYLWYEGEDKNCKSDNLTETLDSLQVDVTFDISDAAN